MLYLRIVNEQIVYPYDLEKLKIDYPNTSFPEKIHTINLIDYNINLVNIVSKPSNIDYTKNYTEGTPVLVDGQYYQNWIVTDATPEEINQRLDVQWSVIRRQRYEYLSECDWTQLTDSPLSEQKKSEWSIYRQELRDITSQPDPFNIVWPTKPENN